MEDKILYIENLRKKILNHMLIILGISITPALFIFFPLSLSAGILPASLFILIFTTVILFLILGAITGYFKKYKEYKHIYKKAFVEGPFNHAFDKVRCDFKKGISKDVIEATKIIMLGNRYYSNDYISGSYNNVDFERSDVLIQNHTSNGKNSHTVTYFQGRWLIFEFNKKFHFDLQIIGKGFTYSNKRNGFFTSKDNRRRKVEFEDIQFNKDFKVYAQDDFEAFYILTPQFIDTLKNMSNTMDGKFMMGFIDNKLHVAINTGKDAMEPSIFRSIKNTNHGEVEKEINVIINIIEGLNLDRDLYN